MLNHMSVVPRENRPRVTSAVVATVDEDEVLLVDPESAGPSIPFHVVPVIGGKAHWTHSDLTTPPDVSSTTPKATTPLKVFVLCLFLVCLSLSVCCALPSNPATQRVVTASASVFKIK